MHLKKKLLKKSYLYLILDREVIGKRPLAGILSQIRNSKVDIVQYRDKVSKKEDILKNALLIKKFLAQTQKIFIINDYLDVARIIDADGLHLGQNDTSIELARRILGQDKIIGFSAHSLKEARGAQKKGADYLGIGPIFSTPTKKNCKPVGLGLIKKVKKEIRIPFFAIGGIDESNLGKVKASGADRIAVCRAILG